MSTEPAAPRRPRRFRLVLVALVLATVLWLVVAGLWIWSARNLADGAADRLEAVRDDAAELAFQGRLTAELEEAAADLRTAERRTSSLLVSPVRLLPVLGRQLRSFDRLNGAAATTVEVLAEAARDTQSVLDDAAARRGDRVGAARTVAAASAAALEGLDGLDLGPESHLLSPLARARRRLDRELAEARTTLTRIRDTAAGFEEVLRGPTRYLLLVASNAEMRAGSGAFLQIGTLSIAGGKIELSELESAGAIDRPVDVAYVDVDLRDRWGWLEPNHEWRNLALSPRFSVTAAQAAAMWDAIGRGRVDGVLALDPVALQALLRGTGPIDTSGGRISAGDVVDELLVEQYQRFLDPEFDQRDRRDRLREVAQATVDALDSRRLDLEALFDALGRAAGDRHVLAWSPRAEQQAAWIAAGVDGDLAPTSLLLSVINRGGGRGGSKLDPWLEVRARVMEERATPEGVEVAISVSLRNRYPVGRPSYVERAEGASDAGDGTYWGILALNLPGTARQGRIEGQPMLSVAGRDGPTRVIATQEFSLAAGAHRRFMARFLLAAGETVQVEPTARVPAPRMERFGALRQVGE